jgi:hypothetical protein
MRYLITGSERSALAAESGAASVSYVVVEWALAWVSVSGCLKRRLWQLASDSLLPSKLPWLSQSR